MESMKINKSAWHYQMLLSDHKQKLKNAAYWGENYNLCEYVRMLMWSVLVRGFLLFALAVVATGVGFNAYYLYEFGYQEMAAVQGFAAIKVLLSIGMVTTFLLLSAAMLFSAFWVIRGVHWCYNHAKTFLRKKGIIGIRKSEKAPEPPGFLKEVYLSWKHKYCVNIEVVSETKRS